MIAHYMYKYLYLIRIYKGFVTYNAAYTNKSDKT